MRTYCNGACVIILGINVLYRYIITIIVPSRICRLTSGRKLIGLRLIVRKTRVLSSFPSCRPFRLGERPVLHHFEIAVHSFHERFIFIDKSVDSVSKFDKETKIVQIFYDYRHTYLGTFEIKRF